MLKAIAAGVEQLSSEATLSRYRLGNPNTIARNKKVLEEKAFIDSENGKLTISDPVFLLWYKQVQRARYSA